MFLWGKAGGNGGFVGKWVGKSGSILMELQMVFIVLMVSTSVCGTDSMGSNPINHPKCPYGGIGIRNGLRTRTIESSNLSMGTLILKINEIKLDF